MLFILRKLNSYVVMDYREEEELGAFNLGNVIVSILDVCMMRLQNINCRKS